MTHAKESLENFLGESSHNGSGNRLSERNVVSQIFLEIETYRKRGYSLSAIHSALVRGGDLSCTVTTFRTYYYKERRQRSDQPLLPEQDGPHQPAADLIVSMTETLPLQNVEEQISTDASQSKSLLMVSDTELKAQQALAKRLFAQRRAELGMTRRKDN
ncbi:MAG: hypothetical protein AAGA46_17145 [Cyanobacteria bacterium P01_F01_bin.13]